ncbi:MAG: hypothetical protein IJ083_10930 [Clostridia bacterium]|nr:hypothetical protein [Clostridia bacterium]
MSRKILLFLLSWFLFLDPLLSTAIGESLPEETRASIDAFHFDITFEPSRALPDSALCGLTEFLEMLNLKGDFVAAGDRGFSLSTHVSLSDDAGLDAHIGGLEGLFELKAPFLPSDGILLSIPDFFSSALELQQLVALPLHRAALLYPWTSYHAWKDCWDIVHAFMDSSEGNHTVPQEQLQILGKVLEDHLSSSQELATWFDGMSTLNPAGAQLRSLFDDLPAWIENNLQGDVKVQITSDGETWSHDGRELYHFQDNDRMKEIYVFLPGFVQGTDATFRYLLTMREENTYDLQISLTLGSGTHSLFGINYLASHLPDSWPAERDWSCQMTLTGPLLQGFSWATRNENGYLISTTLTDRLHVTINGHPDSFVLSDSSGRLMTVRTNMRPLLPDHLPDYLNAAPDGLPLSSLPNLLISPDAIWSVLNKDETQKLFPLLVKAPVSTVTGIMNILHDSGILDLLCYGENRYTDSSLSESKEIISPVSDASDMTNTQ